MPAALSLVGTMISLSPTRADYTHFFGPTISAQSTQRFVRINPAIEASNQPAIKNKIADARAELESTFNLLAKKWKDETSAYSSVGRMIMHPAYLEIISHGEKMIPYILRDLEQRRGHWFVALKILAKGSPVKSEDAGNIQKMTEAWLAWGREHGKLS